MYVSYNYIQREKESACLKMFRDRVFKAIYPEATALKSKANRRPSEAASNEISRSQSLGSFHHHQIIRHPILTDRTEPRL